MNELDFLDRDKIWPELSAEEKLEALRKQLLNVMADSALVMRQVRLLESHAHQGGKVMFEARYVGDIQENAYVPFALRKTEAEHLT